MKNEKLKILERMIEDDCKPSDILRVLRDVDGDLSSLKRQVSRLQKANRKGR